MSEFAPVNCLADLALLDEQEVNSGFRAGMAGEPRPLASTFSRSFLHGWESGVVAAGAAEASPTQRQLSHGFFIAQPCSAIRSGLEGWNWILQ